MFNRYKAAKLLIYAAAAYLLTIVQSTPGWLEFGGLKPALTFGLAVSVAMLEGEFYGGLFAVWAGLLCDFFSYNKFFYNALLLFVCCVAVGLLVQTYMRPVPMNAFLFTAAAVLFSEGVSFFFRIFIQGYPSSGYYWLVHILPFSLYSALCALPLFLLVHWIHQKFESRLQA